jgi:hypothetical protein
MLAGASAEMSLTSVYAREYKQGLEKPISFPSAEGKMKKYRILTLVLVFIVIAALVVLRRSQVSAQQPAGSVKVTPTTVTRVILFKVNPGQRPAFDQDVMDNLIPVFDEEKKAGILTDYMFFNNVTADNPNDWNVGMTQTYANYAALDNLGERADPITLKHYGSAAKQQAAASHRNQIRSVVSNRLLREVHYTRGANGTS